MSIYDMFWHPEYMLPMPQQAAPIQQSAHRIRSTFSSPTFPDEDWTRISDLAERRRVQNRIAQRNYRKRLKNRLEQLEQLAGSDGKENANNSVASTSTSICKMAIKRTTSKSPPATKTTTIEATSQPSFSPSRADSDIVVNAGFIYDRKRCPSNSTPNLPSQLNGAVNPHPINNPGEPYPDICISTSLPGVIASAIHVTDSIKHKTFSDGNSLDSCFNYSGPPAADINCSDAFSTALENLALPHFCDSTGCSDSVDYSENRHFSQ